MKHANRWYLPAVLLLLQGCGGAERRLDEEVRAWQAAAPSSYAFEYARSCFCPGAGTWWRVDVADVQAAPVDSTYIGKGGPVPPPNGQPTIDSIFAMARRALTGGNDSVAVAYDSAYHFPREINVDHDRRAVDDEWSLRVRAFRPVGR